MLLKAFRDKWQNSSKPILTEALTELRKTGLRPLRHPWRAMFLVGPLQAGRRMEAAPTHRPLIHYD